MHVQRRRLKLLAWLVLVVLSAACGGTPIVPRTQRSVATVRTQLDSRQAPNFGTRNVAPGFASTQVSVIAGGNLDVHATVPGAGCRGFATSQPDFRLNLSQSVQGLNAWIDAIGETALVVKDARGHWHCSRGQGIPIVELTNPPAGQYDFWVASASATQQIRAALSIAETSPHAPPQSAPIPPSQSAPATQVAPASVPEFPAVFTLDWGAPLPQHAELARRLSPIFNEVLVWLNDVYAHVLSIPGVVPIVIGECANTAYYPSLGRIEVCWSNFEIVSDSFQSSFFVALILHEFAHALIHGLNLPVVGREEDVADQFAALTLLGGGAHIGNEVVANSALIFEALGGLTGNVYDAADEHSSALQRTYSLWCLMRGGDPGDFARLAPRDVITALRPRACESEYSRAMGGWNALLRPYARAGVVFVP